MYNTKKLENNICDQLAFSFNFLEIKLGRKKNTNNTHNNKNV